MFSILFYTAVRLLHVCCRASSAGSAADEARPNFRITDEDKQMLTDLSAVRVSDTHKTELQLCFELDDMVPVGTAPSPSNTG